MTTQTKNTAQSKTGSAAGIPCPIALEIEAEKTSDYLCNYRSTPDTLLAPAL
jgi:hypothetical protein